MSHRIPTDRIPTEMLYDLILGKVIYWSRQSRKLSIEELAVKSALRVPRVSMIEQGCADTTLKEVKNMAKALEIEDVKILSMAIDVKEKLDAALEKMESLAMSEVRNLIKKYASEVVY